MESAFDLKNESSNLSLVLRVFMFLQCKNGPPTFSLFMAPGTPGPPLHLVKPRAVIAWVGCLLCKYDYICPLHFEDM